MWGNRIGWMISAVIVLITTGGLWLLSTQNDTSLPTWDPATQAKFLAKVTLPSDPRALVPGVMTKPCDAGDEYRLAIAAYQENKKTYDTIKSDDGTHRDAFEDILKGADCSNMTLLAKDPALYLGYSNKAVAPLDALKGVAMAMNKRGLGLINAKKPDEAKKYYEAIFSLGVKLWEERLVWDELDLAHNVMSQGAGGLARLAIDAKDLERAKALKDFDSIRSKYVQNVLMPVEKTTHNLESGDPGNVFLLARLSQDRMWRSEAMRQLGRIRFNVSSAETASAADQRAATKLLTKWAADETLDPVIRAAAAQGRDVTDKDLQKEVSGGGD